jgi:catechol 2,3-dioxygenase-like lactoylglutathione lyase family enzyme
MRAKRITVNLRVPDVDAAKSFYTDYLGLSAEEFNLGWVARFTSPETGANVQLVMRDATAPEDAVVSVHTADVDAAYDEDDLESDVDLLVDLDPGVGLFALGALQTELEEMLGRDVDVVVARALRESVAATVDAIPL